MEELKKCPFCGKRPRMIGIETKECVDGEWSDIKRQLYWIKPSCDITCIFGKSYATAYGTDGLRYGTLEAAAKAWNRRAEEPPAQPEIIHCCDCIYYDPEHVEKNGVRYEYKDMPKAAFDDLGTGLVSAEYGINVGGKCCRDYNVGYLEDKRVFVSKQNYCGRAERRTNE